jgi:hypothetical protein
MKRFECFSPEIKVTVIFQIGLRPGCPEPLIPKISAQTDDQKKYNAYPGQISCTEEAVVSSGLITARASGLGFEME